MKKLLPWKCHECKQPLRGDEVDPGVGSNSIPKYSDEGYVYCARCWFCPRPGCFGIGSNDNLVAIGFLENAVRALEGE